MKVKHSRGFTLAEMLVVVAIIGILAAILVPAVYMGLVAARNAKIVVETGNLAAALEQYRITHKEYPPNFFGAASGAPGAWSSVPTPVVNHFKRAFPRINFATAAAPPATLDPAQALVFWLSGFGGDPTNPLAGTKTALFNFDQSRLLNPSGTPSYYPAYCQNVPYVYMRADAYANYQSTPYAAAGSGTCKPYTVDTPAGTAANPLTFQIICAGQDGNWGNNSNDKRFPSGTNYLAGDRDNITNFSEGTMGDKQ